MGGSTSKPSANLPDRKHRCHHSTFQHRAINGLCAGASDAVPRVTEEQYLYVWRDLRLRAREIRTHTFMPTLCSERLCAMRVLKVILLGSAG
jgi:hypothetical protein